MIITIAVVLVLTVVCVLVRTSGHNSAEMEAERLRHEYQTALQGSDKKAARKAGRIYYSLANSKGMLTMLDEVMIANDLSTMPEETCNSEPVTK